MNDSPRLRMFAGPNGSGKSTIKSVINSELLGIYVNPDDIESEIQRSGFIDFSDYKVMTTNKELSLFLNDSPLLKKINLTEQYNDLVLSENKLYIPKNLINSYLASVLSDFIRQNLIKLKKSFSFETVMSSPDKIEFLKKAQSCGFRTYLYYVATDDPLINISRVQHRVRTGGHSVPQNKIISRYHRSIGFLSGAIRYTNRTYIFDNSDQQPVLLVEITDGILFKLKRDFIPVWIKTALGEKFNPNQLTTENALNEVESK